MRNTHTIRQSKPTWLSNMLRIVIDQVTVNSSSTYSDKYMEKVREMFVDAASSARMAWCKANNIVVKQVQQRDNVQGLVVTVFYIEVTDEQATDYYLRF